MKLEDIKGIKEVHSTGECKNQLNGDCDDCNLELKYITPPVVNQITQFYECITNCGKVTHVIVRKEVISYD